MTKITSKRFQASKKEIKVIRVKENLKKKEKKRNCRVLGIWSRKFYDPNVLEKQNQNY